jgi:hypothetical protein
MTTVDKLIAVRFWWTARAPGSFDENFGTDAAEEMNPES